MTRLAIFDIDGTLCDSCEAEARCFADAVLAVTGRPLPTLDWSRYAEPTSAGIVAELLADSPGAAARAQEIEEAFVANLRAEHARDPDSLRPISGAPAFFHRLAKKGICTVAIATGGFASEARFKLACIGIDLDAFPHATSSDTPQRRDILALAIRRAGLGPDAGAVYFGDGTWDVHATRALGLPLIGIGRYIATLQSLGAVAVFPDFTRPDEIIEALQTTIRPATSADAPAIARIHVETWRHAYRGIIPAAFLDSLSIERRTVGWEQNLRKTPDATLVVELAGAVVGWVSFGPCRDEGESGEAELYAIYLDPAHQRAGLGRSLMAEAERALAARQPAARRITLWVLEKNLSARRFYESLGYAHASGSRAKTELIGGEPFVELRYEKPLPRPDTSSASGLPSTRP